MQQRSIMVSDASRNKGLALIRELGRAGFKVQGADTRRLPLGLHSRYSPPYLRYDMKRGGRDSASLLEMVSSCRPEVFLPITTDTTEIVCRERDQFEDLTHVNVPPYEAFLKAADNEITLKTCARLGIPCPQLFSPSEAIDYLSSSKIQEVARRIVVKPRRDIGAARGVHIVADPIAMQAAVDSNTRHFGGSVLQEYIPGDARAMRLVLVLFDKGGDLRLSLTSRKVLEWPETGGLAALAVSTHEPELVDLARPFFESVGWRGAAEVELKYDSRDGLAKIIEINPRVPSYMGFPERCGLPFGRMLVDAARETLRSSATPVYQAGVPFYRTGELLRLLLHRLRGRGHDKNPGPLIWEQLRAGARPASLDFTDPLPRIGKVLAELAAPLRAADGQQHG